MHREFKVVVTMAFEGQAKRMNDQLIKIHPARRGSLTTRYKGGG
jgi:hypothetical protein